MAPRNRLPLCTPLAALLLLATSGCGDVPEGTWAARLPEADAWLAVRMERGHAAAFVCGDEERLGLSRWMHDYADDKLEFEQDGVTLSLDVTSRELVGTLLDPNGVAVSVSAPRLATGGLAGLYTAVDAGERDGLILLPAEDGEEPDVEPDGLGVWRDTQGNLAQVTPVKPIALEALGLPVTVNTGVELREFFMTLVVPADVEPSVAQ